MSLRAIANHDRLSLLSLFAIFASFDFGFSVWKLCLSFVSPTWSGNKETLSFPAVMTPVMYLQLG